MWNKTQHILIISNSILLLLFIFMLTGNYRLVPEDYYAVAGNHQYGILEQARKVCQIWGGRFISYLFSFLLLDMYEKGVSFSWYFLAGCLVLWISFSSMITYIAKSYFLPVRKADKIATGGLIFILLFYMTPGKTESWFWAGASASYFWGLVMAVSGSALLMLTSRKWYHVLVSSLCFLYSCSASEPFALMIIFFFLVFLVTRFYFNKNMKSLLPFLLVFASCLAGFVIMFKAQGTVNRWMAMPELTLSLSLKRCSGAVVKYYLYWFPAIFSVAVILVPAVLNIALWLTKQQEKIRFITPFKFVLYALILYTAILFLAFLPSCYVMGEAGPVRSWHHLGIYNVILFFVITGYFGYRYFHPKKNIIQFINFYLLLLTFVHFSYLFTELEKARRYSVAVDQRILFLKALQEREFKGEIKLARLPDSGLLFSAEIGKEKDYYINKFLKQGLGLEYEVSLQ